MADFQSQAMGLTGLTIDASSTTPSRTEFSTFLNDGVIDVTSRWILVRPQDIDNFTRESVTTASNGFATAGAKIISVIREAGADGDTDGSTAWEPCRKIPVQMQSRVVDVDSLSYASKYNPAYIIDSNGLLNVYPIPDGTDDGYKVFYVNNSPEETDGSALDHASTGIKWFPADKVYLVVLYASMKSLQANLGAINISTFSLTTSAPVAIPGNPSITGVSVGAITVASLPTAPDYVSPTTTISGETWASEYPHAEVDITTPLAAIAANIDLANGVIDASPVPPDNASAFSLSSEFTDAIAKAKALIDTATMGGDTESESAQYWLNNEDPEMVASTIQVASQELQRANTALQGSSQTFTSGLGKFSAEVQAYQAEIGEMSARAQGYIQAAQGYATEVKTRLSTTQTKIAEYQARVQDALNEFNDANVVYQAGVQRNIQQAQIDMQDAQKEADIDLQEKIQDYTLELQRVSTDQQKYQGLVNAEIQTYQQEMAEKNAEYQWMAARIKDLKEEYDKAFMIAAPKQQPQQQVRR